ncbi:putative metallophosphoesterase [bacterium BMS3Abin09]|nr:putative metallophosphoesterase [bacterium BMS3Abin09]GBE41385.1 putative metallophosphoesterase [bacterium BMS3Bbin09]HDO66743.1 metallophosphoesterase [Nitrospirota bacterium]HEW80917.1 metallophosphoesterase [Nitrospirota bacterium]
MPSARLSFLLPAVLALAIGVYGYYEAGTIRTEHLVIKTTKIPKDKNRFRIVQISDVHLGLIIGEERLRKIIEAIRSADPDLLVSTGDLVDGQIDGLHGLAELFGEIKAPYGKFAVPGNHEYYAGFDKAMEFIRDAGFTILKGVAVNIPRTINIAGVDDPEGMRFGLYKDIRENEILSTLDPNQFTLLLKHRPIIDKVSLGMFDLQLSGHTHNGQIFPFNLIVQIFFPNISGYFPLKGNSHLYVSRGTGTWGPPIRFLSPPEVTVIDLVREGGD